MKKIFLFITVTTLIIFCACFFIFSFYLNESDNAKKFPPCLNNGKKWKIGYYQSGKSLKHNFSLKNYLDHLAEMGWLKPLDWEKLPEGSGTKELWSFLAKNMQSKYLRIEKKHFWCSEWNQPKRRIVRKQVLSKLQNNEVDLMLVMGTWPGQDLANNLHSTPTLYLESYFPIRKLFKESKQIPDHLYLARDSHFLQRQIRLFRRITKFKVLGVVYVASSEGRFRSSLKLLKNLSKEKKFKLVVVRVLPHDELTSEERLKEHIKAHEKIAPQIDAMWLTSSFMERPESACRILAPFFKYKVPTWYPHGRQGVANGAIFGVIHNPHKKAQYYAEITAKIFNGVKPESQMQNLPIDNHLAINCASAKKIGFKIPRTLLGVAKQSYLNINTGDNQ